MTFPIGEYRMFSRSTPLRALLLSLGLHGLLLAPSPLPELRLRPASATAPLQATLAGRRQEVFHPAPLLAAKKLMPQKSSSAPAAAASSSAAMASSGDNLAVVAAASDSDNLDAEGLRSYRMALAVQSRRFWRYPDAARQAGLRGTVELRIAVLPLGGTAVDVARSSGHGVLDEAALAMVRAAAQNAPVPETLHGQRFSLRLPVLFSPE